MSILRCKIFKNAYFVEHLQMDASLFSCIANLYEKYHCHFWKENRVAGAGGRGGIHQLI